MSEGPPNKRPRSDEQQTALVVANDENDGNKPLRASSLFAPTIRCSGHTGSVYALEYSPTGETLCSTSFDKTCLLWDHTGQYENYNVLAGHKNAVLDCAWTSPDHVVSVGADRAVILWDALTGSQIRKWQQQQHTGIVNAVSAVFAAPTIKETNIMVTVSDDCTALIWDTRVKKTSIGTLESEYPLTAVCATAEHVYTGGIDNLITAWDMKMNRRVYSCKGHTDTITCLALHPAGTHILSNSMDHTLRSWDIRPFVADGGKRHCKTFTGHRHNAEKGLLKCAWNAKGDMVTAGSADKAVHIWDEHSTEELYLLPGHKGCVNAVTFHPSEHNVVASGGSDKQIFVGELS